MRPLLSLTVSLVIILSSCSQKKNEAMKLSRDFFTSLSDTSYGKPSDFYPAYDTLQIEAKSDVVEIEESDISEKNDTITVRCFNNYTDEKGTFRQDSVLLFIAKNTEKQWRIFDSKGLISIDKDLLEFGTKVGAFGNKSLNDLAMAQRLKTVRSMLFSEYLDVNIELRTKVKITNWSWETSYDGTAHGDGRVVNTLDYSVSGIKYTVSYYDRSDNFMGDDDGSISKTLSPGEKYNFSFWSSNVKYPHTARIRLDFSDKMIFDIIQGKWYTGNEYKEYIKEK